tara:strand:- start:1419 stop:1742 length:324 start_codon:yes stop_codon:yes gene_type:complete
MPRSHVEVEILIIKLEQSLRDAMLWSSSKPSNQALQSMVPFAFDSMPFEQWLQFIFIPKMSEIIRSKKTLPNNLKILPMAEQSLGTADNRREVIEVIKQIDLIFWVS